MAAIVDRLTSVETGRISRMWKDQNARDFGTVLVRRMSRWESVDGAIVDQPQIGRSAVSLCKWKAGKTRKYDVISTGIPSNGYRADGWSRHVWKREDMMRGTVAETRDHLNRVFLEERPLSGRSHNS